MSLRDELVAHLEYFRELGVDGVNRGAAWRTRRRPLATPRAGPAAPGVPAGASTPSGAAGGQTAAVFVAPVRQGDLLGETDRDRPEARARTRAEGLRMVRDDLGDCTRCKLHRLGRRQIVFGVGNPEADLMFVGEAPGRDEDLQGEPFVGRAGQLLTKMIEAMGLTRDEVYIANVVKCRPPENRNPEPDEVAACSPFLIRQIDVIRPKVIVALGAIALKALLGADAPISRLRGRVFEYRGAKLVPTYHPAFLLRSPDRKREAWEDLKTVLALLRGRA